jgi:hypothetical protein
MSACTRTDRHSARRRFSDTMAAGAALLVVVALSACGAARLAPRDSGVTALVVPAQCVNQSPDSDGDGLPDTCEVQLIREFAPVLMFSSTRCVAPGPLPREEVPGGYFHAAQPVRDAIRLVYLPAYYRDCGWTGAKCLIADCAPHAGDSELIAIDVVPHEGNGWRVKRIFLSAHCFGRIRSDCRWYEEEELDEFEWIGEPGSAPIIWVSDGRHANYPSRRACDRGHLWIDACDVTARPVRFPARASRNIGSRSAPLSVEGQPHGCVPGSYVEPGEALLVSPRALECFWDGAVRFGGWQGGRNGATAYGRYLELMLN